MTTTTPNSAARDSHLCRPRARRQDPGARSERGLRPIPPDRPRLTPLMGLANRAPGIEVMGGPDAARSLGVFGGPDAGLLVHVMGGPDLGPRRDVMGDSDSRFVDSLFNSRRFGR